MDESKYDIVKTYRVVRLRLQGYALSLPYYCHDGAIGVVKIHYEIIDFGGKKYRCAKDHGEKVIYIDTHAMEEAVEGSS